MWGVVCCCCFVLFLFVVVVVVVGLGLFVYFFYIFLFYFYLHSFQLPYNIIHTTIAKTKILCSFHPETARKRAVPDPLAQSSALALATSWPLVTASVSRALPLTQVLLVAAFFAPPLTWQLLLVRRVSRQVCCWHRWADLLWSVLWDSGPVTWILSANVSLLFLRLVPIQISCVQHVTVFFIWESKRSDRISRTKDLYRRREDKLQLECGRVESSVYNNGHF